MKHLQNLCFSDILLKCVSLSAYNAGGAEVFFHDTHIVQQHLNIVSPHFQDIIDFTMPALPALPLVLLDNYRFFTHIPAAIGLAPVCFSALPPAIMIPQKATLAIKRFLIGITNGHHNLGNFADPNQIINAAFAGLITPYVTRALNCGGYNDITARFLHCLLTGMGFPLGLGGPIGATANSVVILLSLDKRVSKNMKEIHWNSSSLLTIAPPIAGAVAAAFPAIGAVPLAYNSIKTILNNHFPVGLAPHSATVIAFRRTSDN